MQGALSYRTNRDLFSNHYLDDLLPETEAWQSVDEEELREAYDSISTLFEEQANQVESYNEHQLERHLIRPVFNRLDLAWEAEEAVHGGGRRPDYAFFKDDEDRQHAFTVRDQGEDFYRTAIAVGDAKRWGRPLDKRSGHEEEFSNPSFQIHIYLQQTPPDWGILTNGKQWRLYHAPSSYKFDSYYEIDLPTVLEEDDLEAFRYFYLFFRRVAFVEDSTGRSFLDRVHEGSNAFAQELGDDLRENIYEAIGVLAEGFLEYEDDLSGEDLDLIHDASLTYLYRLIFVLYAESEGRHLLDTREETYRDRYSLTTLKREVCDAIDDNEDFYAWETRLWDRLDRLFTLIDRGSENFDIDPNQLYIPAYDGGLFKTEDLDDASRESRFLQEHAVGDEHLAQVIDLLTRREAEDGSGMAFVDYSSLGVRHLGSIYEGLLEYQLNVAEEPMVAVRTDDGQQWRTRDKADSDDIVEGSALDDGDVYLTTDTGERKATGSYYTPEYVVQYIIQETLDPLVEEIREDLLGGADENFAEAFADRVFDLTILDPAMGSGHFLVDAVDYLAKEIIEAQEQQQDDESAAPVDESHDIHWARRQIAQRCIYGVDLNPMATELAKVSLWLRTLAAEQPLAFLDHHLKTGNSLVGSDIEDVLENGAGDDGADDDQLTLTQSFYRTRRQALDHVTDRFQELLAIDNETLEDIREMETVFEEVRGDPLYQHMLAMANVHTADEFGLDVPSDAYERMAAALRDDSWDEVEEQDWFRSAQAMASEERFFHWELEFPVAFYGEDGERDDDAGFDAVIGNPPYVSFGLGRVGTMADTVEEYLRGKFLNSAEYKISIYALFMELCVNKSCIDGFSALIVPDSFLTGRYFSKIREYLLRSTTIDNLVLFEEDFWESGDVGFPTIYVARKMDADDVQTSHQIQFARVADLGELLSIDEYIEINQSAQIDNPRMRFSLYDQGVSQILNKMNDKGDSLGNSLSLHHGIRSKIGRDQIISDEKEGPDWKRALISSGQVTRFHIDPKENYIHVDSDILFGGGWDPEKIERDKILIRRTGDSLICAVDRFGFYHTNALIYGIPTSDDVLLSVICAILNSTLIKYYYRQITMSEGRTLPQVEIDTVENIPIWTNLDTGSTVGTEKRSLQVNTSKYDLSDEILEDLNLSSVGQTLLELTNDVIETLVENIRIYKDDRLDLSDNLLDYLGNYTEGPNLPDIGLFQPTSTDILDSTTEDHEKLNIGEVRTERDGSSVTIYATARYKPEDEDEHETDRWGYTETDYLEAFTLADLSETETALVEAFVPVAVEEADGFAGFRDNATKTTSLVDRLKAITLPDPDDVADDLRRYVETKERADELDEKIEQTDQLIDEIVYELYGLSDDEIEIVEGAVAN